MADVSGASLSPIYERLSSAPTYHPLEADTFADWSLEAGDVVTVTRDNRSYESPVHSSTLIWKKQPQVTISSTGNEKREAISKVSQKKFSGGGSGGLRNAENTYYAIETSYNGMRSGLILASSSAHLYTNNKYTQMQSGLYLTSSTAHLYTNSKYTQMQSGLHLTSSTAHLYTNSKYTQMQSGLYLTSSTAHLYTNNKYTQMQSGLHLTSSTAHLYTNSKYTQMQSGLYLTSSTAHLYTNNKYAQMQSGLYLTSSSAHLYTDSKYTQMQSGLRLTSSSSRLYVESKTTKAELILSITDGKSSAKLTADTIDIDGVVESLASKQITVDAMTCNGNILANSIDVNHVYLGGSFEYNIYDASVDDNTLTLYRVSGNDITFSKATTLRGSWDSGSYTVTATPQGEIITTNITSDPTNAERSGSLIYIPIVTPTGASTGYRAWANFISKMTSHSNATDNLHRYNTGSRTTLYIKLGDDYSPAGTHYWYYKDSNDYCTTYYS